MGILARLVEGVNAADIGALLAAVWLVVRLESLRSENAAAHDAVTKKIDGLKQDLSRQLEGVKQDLARDIDGLKEDVKRLLAGDVAQIRAVLRDRQRHE